MLRNEWINDELYKNICKGKNFIYLNGENILHPKTSETIMEYIDEDEKVKKTDIDYILMHNFCLF